MRKIHSNSFWSKDLNKFIPQENNSQEKEMTFLDNFYRSYKKEPNKRIFTFIDIEGNEAEKLTYSQLYEEAQKVASFLLNQCKLNPRDRVLLVYPQSLDVIKAFLGCLLANVIPVPVAAPDPMRLENHLHIFKNIAEHSGSSLALTNGSYLLAKKLGSAKNFLSFSQEQWPDFKWCRTDNISQAKQRIPWRRPKFDDIAYLQYTSGSTSYPKGVMVSYRNLSHQMQMVQNALVKQPSRAVFWAPYFHDMCLVYGIVSALNGNFDLYLLSPLDFLRKPSLWFETMSRVRATHTTAPTFALELVMKKTKEEQFSKWDLSCIDMISLGGEPNNPDTLARFHQKFADYGLKAEVYSPAYGMAEHTLGISTFSPYEKYKTISINRKALEKKNIALKVPDSDSDSENALTLVSCGPICMGVEAIVVDPEKKWTLYNGQIGEIWVRSTSKCSGYFEEESLSQEVFYAQPADRENKEKRYLRTGDLGFIHEGEIYLVGRSKDVLIFHGRNVYPQDIEDNIRYCHPLVRPGGVVAFSAQNPALSTPEERLAVIVEIKTKVKQSQLDEIVESIRKVVYEKHEVPCSAVIIGLPSTIIKTTSGKLARKANSKAFIEGKIAKSSKILHISQSASRSSLAKKEELCEELCEELAETTLSPSRENIEKYMRQFLAQEMEMSPEQIKSNENLQGYGMDSVTVTRLITRLADIFELEVSVREIIEHPTIASLADYLIQESQLNLLPESIEKRMPLSEGQRGLWMLQKISPSTSAYNLPLVFSCQEEFDLKALKKAYQFTLDQYPILKTSIEEDKGVPYQYINRSQPLCIEEEKTEDLGEEQCLAYIQENIKRPFLLDEALIRLNIFWRTQKSCFVLITVHHIVFDGVSATIFAKALWNSYFDYIQEKEPQVISSETNYHDFLRWEEKILASEKGKKHLSYWEKKLAGDLPVLSLPFDRARKPTGSSLSEIYEVALSSELAEKARSLAISEKVSLSTLFLTAWKTLLHRYSEEQDIVVGIPTLGRPQRCFEETIGYFTNMLPIRSEVSKESLFSELLEQIKFNLVDGIDHSYPFPRLVSELKVKRVPSVSPIFQVFYAYQNFIRPTSLDYLANEDKKEKVTLQKSIHQQGDYDLGLEITETKNLFSLCLEYNPDLFNLSSIKRMMEHYINLLGEIANDPSLPIALYDFFSPAEREKLLVQFSQNPRVDFSPNKTIVELFEEQVEKTPDNIAVFSQGEKLTYKQLNEQANQLARLLQESKVQADQIVAIMMERSLEMIVGVLGILKSGGAYLPIDPVYPTEHIGYLLEDSQTQIILTSKKLKKRLTRFTGKVIHLENKKLWQEHSPKNLSSSISKENLAYIIYTSGSTGKPKGVMIEHRSLSLCMQTLCEYYKLRSQDRVLQFTSLSFDVSAEEIYPTLLTGAMLVLRNDKMIESGELLKRCQEWQITVLSLTTAFWHELVTSLTNEKESLSSSIRMVVMGGEAVLPEKVKMWQKHNHNVTLLYAYGVTEATSVSIMNNLSTNIAKALNKIPIGKPLANEEIYILDEHLQPVPINVAGGLYIGGSGLARGYLNRPQLNAERFIAHPFEKESQARLYKTGDLARYLENGDIEFLGRIDNQVKIRGFRVEPGEVEVTLSRHPMIQEALVLAQGEPPELIAYITLKKETSITQINQWLRDKLPRHMIPKHFVKLAGLPITPNGKLDYKALPLPNRSLEEETFLAPRNDLERKITSICEEVLGIENMGVKDEFFERGGHSLALVELIAKVNDQFLKEIPLEEFMESLTIESLAKFIKNSEALPYSHLSSLQALGDSAPLFCTLAGHSDVLLLKNVARYLSPTQPMYTLRPPAYDFTFSQLAKAYADEIERAKGEGPIHIFGYSLGGVAALETYRELKLRGCKMGQLLLLDSFYPYFPKLNFLSYWLVRWTIQSLGLKKLYYGVHRLEQIYFDPGIKSQVKALKKYKKLPYEGKITLLIAAKSRKIHLSFFRGWRNIAREGVQSIVLEGGHQSILRDPYVKGLSEKICSLLEDKNSR